MLKLAQCVVMVMLLATAARGGLTAGELLLVTNKNVAGSQELAQHYAAARGVDARRILSLDLPKTEAILPADFDARLAAPVRAYLTSADGKDVRCVVLFMGVPLKVRALETSEALRQEAQRLRAISDALLPPARELADRVDQIAKSLGVAVQQPPPGDNAIRAQQQRIAHASGAIQRWSVGKDVLRLGELKIQMDEAAGSSRRAAIDVLDRLDRPPTTQPATQPAAEAAARATQRRSAAEAAGIFPLLRVIDEQYVLLSGEDSDAAVDSELALVRNERFPRFRWLPNPLSLHAKPTADALPAVMTARIDGPTERVARRLIDDAVAVEKSGLDGVAVFDSRGLPAPAGTPVGGYPWYDQSVRDAAALLKSKSTLKVVTDDREQVLLPKSVDNVAIYCGWYSLQNYVPGCTYVRGAVGFHVASLELTTLQSPLNKEWVQNLLNAGVDGTLGAVSEPYLHAFPKPDEFFPLLLSGRFTLAEVYWKTVPMTSWKLALVGDPLYNPFAAKAAIKLEDTPLKDFK